jgi:hypothetical protein
LAATGFAVGLALGADLPAAFGAAWWSMAAAVQTAASDATQVAVTRAMRMFGLL